MNFEAKYQVRKINDWTCEVISKKTGKIKVLNVVQDPASKSSLPPYPQKSSLVLKDLRSRLPPIYDQGNLGSCVSNCLCSILEFMKKKSYSRLFNYFASRGEEAKVEKEPTYLVQDTGLYLVSSLQSIQKYGICLETLYPYQPIQFNYLPSAQIFINAYQTRSISFAQLPKDLNSITNTLNRNIPIMFGMLVYENFFDAKKNGGFIPLPQGQLLGGHCLVLVGYTETHFIIRNSWGPKWGDKGYGYILKEHLISPSCFDFYIVTRF